MNIFIINIYIYKTSIYLIHYTELFCVSDPCMNGATCQEDGGGTGFICVCPDAFTGTNCQTGETTQYKFNFILSYHIFESFSVNCQKRKFRIILGETHWMPIRHSSWIRSIWRKGHLSFVRRSESIQINWLQ